MNEKSHHGQDDEKQQQQQQQQHFSRPSSSFPKKANKDLTPDERNAKRELKRQLKVQQRRARLETRLRHAIKRGDSRTHDETRQQLLDFNHKHSPPLPTAAASFSTAHVSSSSSSSSLPETKMTTETILSSPSCNKETIIKPHVEETVERAFVMSICRYLQRMQQGHCHLSVVKRGDRQTKETQTEQAVCLMRHMTKGTQERAMFQNSNALWGYTRQKFLERATLVCNSFLKLQPPQATAQVIAATNVVSSVECTEGDNHELCRHCPLLWQQLCSVRQICSIGCGPGNDAIGVVAFLKAIHGEKTTPTEKSPQLERAVLLDWAMKDWKQIIDPLCQSVVPECIQTVDVSSCDVTESLLNADVNRGAKRLLVCANDNAGRPSSRSKVDLFLISYLLTETRGQWRAFVQELIETSKPGALFFFAEPTPWQLHILKDTFNNACLDFLWLDSSMDNPQLQPLDNRVGPGVLLARKRLNSSCSTH